MSEAPRRQAWALHVTAGAGFLLLAVILTWPLVLHLTNHVPGDGAADNLTFLWNFWWMRHALESSSERFFQTPFLFYPLGSSLVVHTHTGLNALAGATLLSQVSIVTAQNAIIIGSIALNGFCAYLLAWVLTRHPAGSMLAGLFFAASPYFSGHLHGHFNLVSAWCLPLFALMWLRALDRVSTRHAILSGAVLALAAYTDYYYVIYLGVFVLITLGLRWSGWTWRRLPQPHPRTRLDVALLSILLLLATAAVVIIATGGLVFFVGPLRVSATTGLNVLTAAWLVLFIWLWRRWRPSLIVSFARSPRPAADAWVVAVMTVVFVAGVLPLLFGGWQLWRQGDYVSQQYFWRSAPGGVDLASLVGGNPFHPVWGPAVQRFYAMTGMNAIENTAWFGVVPIAFLLATRSQWRAHPEARLWLTAIVLFFIWALGPYLTVFGFNTGLFLPETLLRYVPVVANARIPGRAVVMVYLGIAMLLALAMASSRLSRRTSISMILGFAILLDFLAAPFPLFGLDKPSLYVDLAALPSGAVLELPLGIRDGFGEQGLLDHRVLYYQSIHEKPIVGGFVARMPASVRRRYLDSPLLGAVLRLSAGEPVPPDVLDRGRAAATGFCRRHNIRYVVLNRATAPPPLQQFAASALPLRLLLSRDDRDLYAVDWER